MARDGGNKDLAETMKNYCSMSGINARRNLFSLQTFVERNKSTKLNSSGHVWSLEGSIIVYILLFQLRWTQDKFFADHCRKSYLFHDGDYVVFVECGRSTFWTCGKSMDEIENQQDLFALPGQNIRGWILTFITHFNCLLEQGFSRADALMKSKEFFVEVFRINPGPSPMFHHGLANLLNALEKFDKALQGNMIWLDQNSLPNYYDPDLYGVNHFEKEKEEEEEVVDVKRFCQGIVIFSLGYILGLLVCSYQFSFDLLLLL